MKILHIINNLAKGGAEKLLTDVLPHFKNAGIDVSVLLLSSNGSAPEYIENLEQEGIKINAIKDSGSLYDPGLLFKLKKIVNDKGPDILHVHLFPAMYWVALAKRTGLRLPMVFTEHSTQNRRLNNRLFALSDRFIYNSYDRLVAISPAISLKLKARIANSANIKIIRNGVNVSRFVNAVPYDKFEFNKSLGWNSNTILLMMTARFAYPKDQKTIINALEYLPDHYHLLLVGDGKERASTEQYVADRKLGHRVCFMGFRMDVPQLMKTADVNILSSLYEGMSGVTCEALASGKPFLGTDVPGISDVIPDNRFLFEVKNPKQLGSKIAKIISDAFLREKMIKSGLDCVKQYDVGQMVNETIAMYSDILESRKSDKKQ